MPRSLSNNTDTVGDSGGGGGSATQVSDLTDGENVVTKTGSQTISGTKVFSQTVTTDQSSAAYALVSKHGYVKARNTNSGGNAMLELESALADT